MSVPIDEGVLFNCEDKRRRTSINRQISRECGKQYPTGIVRRELNAKGIYEYFTE